MTVTSTSATLGERCADALVQIDEIIHLGTMAAERVPARVADAVRAANDTIADALDLPRLALDGHSATEITDAIFELNLRGWLVHATTARTARAADGYTIYDWDDTTSAWFYATDYDTAVDAAIRFADNFHAGIDRYDIADL